MAGVHSLMPRVTLRPRPASGSICRKTSPTLFTQPFPHTTAPWTSIRSPTRNYHAGQRLSDAYRYGGGRRAHPHHRPHPDHRSAPSFGSGMRTANIVVGGAIAVCAGVFLYSRQIVYGVAKDSLVARIAKIRSTRLSERDFYQNLVVSRENVREGRWWTLITHTFTHLEWWHLGVNMMSLWSLGRPLVAFFGAPTFVVTWLVTGAGGAAVSAYMPEIKRVAYQYKLISTPPRRVLEPDIPGLGASGSICGMLGLLTCVFPRTYGFSTAMFCAFSAFCYQTGTLPSLGHLDHLGGVGVGAVLGLYLKTRWGLWRL
ncbi:MAG: hypothetical protein M1818_001807 [Claussenomyces sp. TS43310]|nr:MAG: hypothetical protein M1818_001807 [Claussenomyces sp. TS43310]